MKKSIILTFLCIMTCIINYSQSKKSKDIESIKSMCGCFKIDFNFAETFVFSNDEDYKKTDEERKIKRQTANKGDLEKLLDNVAETGAKVVENKDADKSVTRMITAKIEPLVDLEATASLGEDSIAEMDDILKKEDNNKELEDNFDTRLNHLISTLNKEYTMSS